MLGDGDREGDGNCEPGASESLSVQDANAETQPNQGGPHEVTTGHHCRMSDVVGELTWNEQREREGGRPVRAAPTELGVFVEREARSSPRANQREVDCRGPRCGATCGEVDDECDGQSLDELLSERSPDRGRKHARTSERRDDGAAD